MAQPLVEGHEQGGCRRSDFEWFPGLLFLLGNHRFSIRDGGPSRREA